MKILKEKLKIILKKIPFRGITVVEKNIKLCLNFLRYLILIFYILNDLNDFMQ